MATSARPEPDLQSRVERLRVDIQEYRETAWRTALQVAAVYDHVSAESCPGLASFVRDLRGVQREVEADGALDLGRIDFPRLVTNNPHFWRANLEVSPSDGTFLLLHGTLLGAAGQIWKANRIVVATTQLLPMDTQVRALFLAHSYGLAALILQAQEIAQAQLGRDPLNAERVEQRAIQGLRTWPENAVLLAHAIERRAAANRSWFRRSAAASDAKWDKISDPELRRLIELFHALDPVGAARYRGDSAAREQGRRLNALWARMAAKDEVLDHKQIGDLVAGLERAGASDLALLLQRLQIATRGFASPQDAAGFKRMIPALVVPQAAEALLAALDRGEINAVEVLGGRDALRWRGDPSTNPLIAQQIEREIADCTFQISLLRGNPAAQAIAYRRRGVQQSRGGFYDEALVDFDIAIRLSGRKPTLLADQAAIYGTLGRDADAEAIFEELARSEDGRSQALHSFGLFRFGQGRFDEARSALLEEVKRSQHRNVYAAILAELAARRLGQTEKPLLQRVRNVVSEEAWARHCLDFLLGGLSEEQLRLKASEGGELAIAQKTCEVSFIFAQLALAEGQSGKGMGLLESCIETGMTGFAEFALARLELQRVAPEREARYRRVPDELQPAKREPSGAPPNKEKAAEATQPKAA